MSGDGNFQSSSYTHVLHMCYVNCASLIGSGIDKKSEKCRFFAQCEKMRSVIITVLWVGQIRLQCPRTSSSLKL